MFKSISKPLENVNNYNLSSSSSSSSMYSTAIFQQAVTCVRFADLVPENEKNNKCITLETFNNILAMVRNLPTINPDNIDFTSFTLGGVKMYVKTLLVKGFQMEGVV